jgi:hypothetical protein
MKTMKFTLYIALMAILVVFSACEDASLNPIKQYETAVHGQGVLTADSPKGFKEGDLTTPMKINLAWRSIDGLNTVTKMDLFITWNEAYLDNDKNPRVAALGTRKLKTVEGGTVPANNANLLLNISPTDIATLFSDVQFDYGDGKGKVSVFSAPKKPNRTATTKFISDDSFSLSWGLTTADGRYFDSWSPAVCAELVGANCSVAWKVTK